MMPTKEQVQAAVALIRKPGANANYVYFFGQLDDPSWIEPLKREGFFVTSPGPIRAAKGIAYPTWPESGYLLRMAEHAPAEVAAVLPGVRATDNPRVHADLARIAARLPASQALTVTKGEFAWLKEQELIPLDLPEALGELAVHLAQLGKTKRAGELMREVLRLAPAPEKPQWIRSGQARMERWTYQQTVSQTLPALHELMGLDAVRLAADILEDAIALTDAESPVDHSEIWRRAIEDDSNNLDVDPPESLIAAVRDVALAEADDDAQQLADVVKDLFGRPWNVFRRVALQVLTHKSEIAPALAEETLLDEDLLTNHALVHEYTALLAAVYPRLDHTKQSQWIKAVERGPSWPSRDPDERKAQEISEEEYVRYRDSWRKDRLGTVQALLPEDRQAEVASLIERFGPPSEPNDFQITSWVGPTSPLSQEEFAAQSPADLVNYLRSWKPSGEPMSPSPEGLGRRMTERIAQEPAPFALLADQLSKLEPTYVRSALRGFEQAAKQDLSFSWENVLLLAETTVKGPSLDAEVTGHETMDRDTDWHWARGEAASALRVAMTKESMPKELADRVWAVLEPMSWDDEPSLGYEKRYGGSNMDPLTLSLNTVRGQAMHAVIEFAVWKKKQTSDDEPFAMSSMPDVGQNLERHLDTDREPSETVRAVFGSRLHQLLWVDREWLASQVPRLFPSDAAHDGLRLAVWESYLAYGSRAVYLFDLLRSEYRRAVDDLPTQEARNKRAGRNPGLVLAEHLGALYYAGTIDREEGGLLDRFVERASTDEAAHLVDYIGRSVHRLDASEMTEDEGERLRALWEWLVDRSKDRPGDRREVLAGFGWWYGSDAFDAKWRDEQLLMLLREQVPVDPDFVIFERLGERATEDLQSALEIVRLLLTQEKAGWRWIGLRDTLREILRLALDSSNQTLANKAREIINTLGAKGMVEFRGLLDHRGSTKG
jgi:hypothetical protein